MCIITVASEMSHASEIQKGAVGTIWLPTGRTEVHQESLRHRHADIAEALIIYFLISSSVHCGNFTFNCQFT